MLKLLYYDILEYQESNLKLLRDHFEVVTLPNPTADTDEILSSIDVALAPLGFDFGREKIDRMPLLKVIGSNTTGEPHIDREYAEGKGVDVFSLKYDQQFLATITPTAEHAWGLLMAVLRRTPWAFHATLEGTWNRRPFGAKSMLSRMSIGIAGLGRLGKLVARYANAFGMKPIRFFDPFVERHEEIPGLIKTSSLEELVRNSDVVSIHIPAVDENFKMFNREIFAQFKKGACLVNTARAELVDENAMLEALEDGTLGAAAIDVFDGEYDLRHDELLRKSPLLAYAKTHDNLLITPHIGGSTYDAWELTERRVIEEILSLLDKRPRK